MQQKIKGNPSQFRGEVNKVAQDVRLLNVTINKIKQQKEQLQTAINNAHNIGYTNDSIYLCRLNNNLKSIIEELSLKEKEKEKSILEQNL